MVYMMLDQWASSSALNWERVGAETTRAGSEFHSVTIRTLKAR